ncbi:hypothetical protein ZEAMMB73_Zm00001d049274 [Zea mays]|uniref:Uncharacterized protein n=1 Tax=Zea mays TaxID=4577 RepID=A0A1D6PTL5_MAIZE|nr:hypothetical protein ZEAMMB73_Zm00001d049274 [Zea mays]
MEAARHAPPTTTAQHRPGHGAPRWALLGPHLLAEIGLDEERLGEGRGGERREGDEQRAGGGEEDRRGDEEQEKQQAKTSTMSTLPSSSERSSSSACNNLTEGGAESDEEIRRVPEMCGASASASSGVGADERPKGEDGKQGQNPARIRALHTASPPPGSPQSLLSPRSSLSIRVHASFSIEAESSTQILPRFPSAICPLFPLVPLRSFSYKPSLATVPACQAINVADHACTKTASFDVSVTQYLIHLVLPPHHSDGRLKEPVSLDYIVEMWHPEGYG